MKNIIKPYEYGEAFIIKNYECDEAGRLKPAYLMRHFQKACTTQVDRTGYTHARLLSMNMVFVMTKITVKIRRTPTIGDALQIYTWPSEPKGAVFPRHFRGVIGEEQLIESVTQWVLIDPREHKILRPAAFPKVLDHTGRPLDLKVERLAMPPEGREVGVRPVRYSDIDQNGHVNNTVYGDILCDFAPFSLKGREIDSFQIQFVSEAVEGETLRIFSAAAGSTGYVSGMLGDKTCFLSNITLR